MNKRKRALEIIRVEYAKHGCSTIIATRAYIENRVSPQAFKEARDKGIESYIISHKVLEVKE